MIRKVIRILPNDKRAKLQRFALQSLILNMLDLISVAYLIPIITLILSREKFTQLLLQFDLNPQWLTTTTLVLLLAVFTLFFLLKNFIQIRINKSLLDYLHRLRSSLALYYVERFLHNDYLTYKKQNKGDLINLVMQATAHFCSKLVYSIVLLFSDLVLLLILLAIAFAIHWQFMTFLLLIFGTFGTSIYLSKRAGIDSINDMFFKLHTRVSAILLDILSGVLDIKSSKSESHFVDSFGRDNEKLNEVTSTLAATGFNYSRYFEICLIICLSFMGYFFFNHSLDILSISVLAALGFKLIPSLSKIFNHLTMIKSHAYAADVLANYSIGERPGQPANDAPPFDQKLSLQGISFGFDDRTLILDQVDFAIKPGEFVGLTGHTGAGKTTLIQILMGLIQPRSGEILVDGQVVNHRFRPFISYVSQEPYLFNCSVLENITMGHQPVDHEYVNYLCEHLQLTDVINGLKHGFDTEVLHTDSLFSGGQKQRISIARALYQKPKLLVLDEATNQQDSESEISIFSFVQTLSKEKNMAVLVVSHNAALQRFYEQTFVIRDGQLKEALAIN